MKRKLNYILPVIMAIVVVSTGSIYAQPRPHDKARDGKRPDLVKILNLTPEQVQQLKLHKEAQKDEQRENMERLKEKNKELHRELMAPDSDSQKVEALQNEISEIRKANLDAKVKSLQALRNILTPEQLQKMDELHEKMEKSRMKNKSNDLPPPLDDEDEE